MSNITDTTVSEAAAAQIAFIDLLMTRVPNMALSPHDTGNNNQFRLFDPKTAVSLTYNGMTGAITIVHNNDYYTFCSSCLEKAIQCRVNALRAASSLNAIGNFTALLNGTVPDSEYI